MQEHWSWLVKSGELLWDFSDHHLFCYYFLSSLMIAFCNITDIIPTHLLLLYLRCLIMIFPSGTFPAKMQSYFASDRGWN